MITLTIRSDSTRLNPTGVSSSEHFVCFPVESFSVASVITAPDSSRSDSTQLGASRDPVFTNLLCGDAYLLTMNIFINDVISEMASSEDVGEADFIELWRENPCLYDVMSKTYSNRNAKKSY